MLNIGEVLQKRYRIVRLLGQGGMGAVYEAIDERFGEPIALKEILVELTSLTDQNQHDLIMKAFEREAKSLAKVRHEAVPYVRDYFSELNRQFLVMELVDGDDLAELLVKRNAPFPLHVVLKWIDQLLDALDYLHNLKPPIIHRDIKPHNLKLSSRGKIKLLDFGIAKSVDNSASTITNQTFVGATLNYSPIEQILRVIDPNFREFILLKHREEAEKVLNQTTDTRCDIYALGASFYHILTNHQPTDVVKRTLEIWEGKPDPLPIPSELNPDISPLISDCLLKSMEIERDKRFSSAAEMRDEIESAIAKEYDRKYAEKTLSIQRENVLPAETIESMPQRLTEAKTDRLLPVGENGKSNVEPTQVEAPFRPTDVKTERLLQVQERELSANSLPSPTLPAAAVSDSMVFESILPNDSLTPYLDESPADKTKPASKFISEPANSLEVRSRPRINWLLAVPAVGIVLAIGTGGILWINSSGSRASDQPAANIVIPTPAASPSATLEPSVVQMVSPTPTPAQQIPAQDDERTKPPVAATRSKPNQPEARKPQTQRTPAPRQDPNCVFTNTCQ